MKHRLWLLTGVISLIVSAGPADAQGRGGAAPPNIVLIVSDDHHWADYGFMGHQVVQTPNIDALAAQSMVYTRAYNPMALCRPSLATIITGLYPHQHGITGNDPTTVRNSPEMPALRRAWVDEVFAKNKTLPELLSERGYVSLQTGKWWEGDPKAHGFSASMTHGDPTRGGRHGDEGLKIGREGLKPITDFIDGAKGRPFFLWYAPMMPHTPHNPPERILAKYRVGGRPAQLANYYAMIEWFDETVGELLSYLYDKGLAQNTVVIYTSDNGWIQAIPTVANPNTGRRGGGAGGGGAAVPNPTAEPAGAAGAPTSAAAGNAGRGGGGDITETRAKMTHFDAGTRAPLMIRVPRTVAAGRDDRSLVSTIDIAPTILRLAGLRKLPEMQGFDLVSERNQAANRQFVYGEMFGHNAQDFRAPATSLISRSITNKDGWKLIVPYDRNKDIPLTIGNTRPGWLQPEVELYNVEKDRSELVNLASKYPEIVTQLRAQLDRWWSPPQ